MTFTTVRWEALYSGFPELLPDGGTQKLSFETEKEVLELLNSVADKGRWRIVKITETREIVLHGAEPSKSDNTEYAVFRQRDDVRELLRCYEFGTFKTLREAEQAILCLSTTHGGYYFTVKVPPNSGWEK